MASTNLLGAVLLRAVLLRAVLLGAVLLGVAACSDSPELTVEAIEGPTTTVDSADPASTTTRPATSAAETTSAPQTTTAPTTSASPTSAPPVSGLPAAGSIEIIELGELDGPTIDFALDLAEGDSWTMVQQLSNAVAIDVPGAPNSPPIEQELTQTVAVKRALDNGNYELATTITATEVLNDEAFDSFTLQQLEEFYAPLLDVEIPTVITRRGYAVEAADTAQLIEDPELAQLIGELEQSTSSLQALPAERVGIGAVWQQTIQVMNQGTPVPTTYIYTLTDTDGTNYELALAVRQVFDAEISDAGGVVTMMGESIGSGVIFSSLGQPVPASSSLTLGGDIELSQGGQTFTMTLAVATDVESTKD